MRRFIIILLVAFFFCIPVSALSFTAEGNGETLEDAKEDARRNLAELVFSGRYRGVTETAEKDGDAGFSSFFSHKSSYTVVGEFTGLEYNVISSKKKKFVVSVTLEGDEATIRFYTNRVNGQKETVEILYSRFTALDSTVSAAKRREALGSVIENYYYYNMYNTILLKFGVLTENIDIPTTFEVLQVDYESLLDEENNELQMKADIESISSEIREELEKNKLLQEEYRKVQEETRSQTQLQRQLILDTKIASIIENGKEGASSLDDGNALGLESFVNYYEVIKNAMSSYEEAKKECESLIASEKESIEKSFSEEAAAIRNRTYPLAHLDSSGNPSKDAKKQREMEIDALRKEKNKEMNTAVVKIESSLKAEIQKRKNYLDEAIRKCMEKEFCLRSDRNEISFSKTAYDANSYSWELTVKGNNTVGKGTLTSMSLKNASSSKGEYWNIIGNASSGFGIDFTKNIQLKYSDLLGIEIPTDEEKRLAFIKNEVYIENVEIYSKLLKDCGYDSSLFFRVEVDEMGTFTVIPTVFEIKFPDGKNAKILIEAITEKKETGVSLKEDIDEPLIAVLYGLQLGGTFGETTTPNRKYSMDLAGEVRLRFTKYFFLSGTFILSIHMGSGLEEAAVVQPGLYAGAGIRLFDCLTLAMRYAYNAKMGSLINPYISFPIVGIETVLGGVYNLKTGKLGFSVAFGGTVVSK